MLVFGGNLFDRDLQKKLIHLKNGKILKGEKCHLKQISAENALGLSGKSGSRMIR